MASAGTSPFVIVSTLLAALAAVYAGICEALQDRMARRLRDWVRESYAEAWEGLPWLHRRALPPRVGLKVLLRQGVITDRTFVDGYAAIARLEHRTLIAIAIGATFIGLDIVGTVIWGWSW